MECNRCTAWEAVHGMIGVTQCSARMILTETQRGLIEAAAGTSTGFSIKTAQAKVDRISFQSLLILIYALPIQQSVGHQIL